VFELIIVFIIVRFSAAPRITCLYSLQPNPKNSHSQTKQLMIQMKIRTGIKGELLQHVSLCIL